MTHSLRLLAGVVLTLSAVAATDLGTFQPRPACTLYLKADGQPTTLRLVFRQGHRPQGDRLMIRLFDPDEHLVHWQYVEPGRMHGTNLPGTGEIDGIPIQIPVISKPGDLLLDTDLQLTRAGVYQLRVTAGAHNAVMEVSVSRPVPYGVSFQNGSFTTWDASLSKAYAFIPPRAEILNVRGGPLVVADAAGAEQLATEADDKTAHTLELDGREAVWSVSFPKPDEWRFQAWGIPFILCPSADFARELRASIVELPDGTIVAHQFQRRILEALPGILAKTGKAEDLVYDLKQLREVLLQDPVRNAMLLNGFDGWLLSINPMLKSQNLDPASHWAGAIDGWQERAEKPAPDNRWDHYEIAHGLWGGITNGKVNSGAEKLAIAATLDSPVNPWFGKQELLYRATASALADLLVVTESETFPGGCCADPYPGHPAFIVGQKTSMPYAYAAPLLPPELRDLWTDAIRHVLDRTYPDGLVTCRNQSSHYLEAYEALAKGSGMARYRDLAKAYNLRFAKGAYAGGFHIEQCGPDTSYIGMTNWHMAQAYDIGRDPVLLKAIRDCYTFFNHTVAPEPDGSMLGGFNFNHRVGQGFFGEQWGGAKGIVDAEAPEVAAWGEQSPDDAEKAAASIEKTLARPDPSDALNSNYGPGCYNLSFPRWLNWQAPAGKAPEWPATAKGPFIHNLGDQLIAVKQAGYYTAVYVGHPAPVDFYVRSRLKFREPYPDDAENTGGGINIRKITPFLGGGLTLLWAPDFGSSLLATCWSPLTHHGLVAVDTGGQRWWEDYFATRWELDAKAYELTMRGRIEGQPVTYERRYRFLPDRIEVSVTLTATEPATFGALFENLPFAAGPAKANGAALSDNGTTLQLRDESGAGLDVVLAQALPVSLQPNGLLSGNLQIARAQLGLPSTIEPGKPFTYAYTLIPVSKPH